MCFVQNDGSELALQQKIALVGFVDNQASGNNRDTERAARDIFRAASLYRVAVVVDPDFLSRKTTQRSECLAYP